MLARRRFLYASFALTALWSLVLVLDWIPQIRGDYGWRWPYELPDNGARILPLVAVIGVYYLGAWLLWRRQAWQLLAWAVLGGIVLSLAALYVSTPRLTYTLFTRTLSPQTTGWHYVSAEMDEKGANHVLSTWAEQMHEYHFASAHVGISPPGMAIMYYGANQVLAETGSFADALGRPLRAEVCHEYRFMKYSNAEFASTWLSILAPLWVALTVIPMYYLGRRYYSEKAARWACLWWGVVPAVVLFVPYPSVIFGLFNLPITLLMLWGLLESRPWAVAVAGFLLSLLIFMSFSVLPLLFFYGVLALGIHAYQWRERPRGWSVLMGAWFGGGLISLWLGYYVLFGEGVWSMFQASMDAHLGLDRPYLPWVFLHLYDYVIFLGFPLVSLAILHLLWIRQERRLDVGIVLSLAVAITLVVLDISGVGRGETGRVWMYFTPYVLLMAGDWVARKKLARVGWTASGFQAVMLAAMVLVLRPIGTGIAEVPSAPRPDRHPSTDYIPNSAIFEQTIVIQDFAGHIETRTTVEGETETVLLVWVRWQSRGQLDNTYFISLLPVAPDGSTQEPVVTQPFNLQYPMTCWSPSSGVMTDYYTIPIDLANVPAGAWWVSLAIMDSEGHRLDVQTASGQFDNQVGIGPFNPLTPAE